jgi:hypothetical protein
LAAVYFSEKKWNLSRYAINGWQVLFGGTFMLPLTLFLKKESVVFTEENILSIYRYFQQRNSIPKMVQLCLS